MILITGGLGFIGVHTAAAFLSDGESVVLTMHRSSRIPDFLAGHVGGRVIIEQVDVADADAIKAVVLKHNVDGIVHLAAPPLAAGPVETEFRSNLRGLAAVLDAASVAKVKRVTIGSSVAVYRGLPNGPFREDALLPMSSTMSVEAFKKSFEILAGYYAQRSDLDVICIRIASVYGPLYSSLVNVPSRIIHAAVQKVPGPLSHQLAPKTFAASAADFVYVEDCARGIRDLQLAPKLNHCTYNLGAGRSTTAQEVANAVKQIFPDAVINLEAGPGPHFRADPFEDLTRIRSDAQFEPAFGLQRAIEAYVHWLQKGNKY